MMAFLSWYLAITVLNWLTFPLLYALFPALADRGYSLARAAGLLVWGYLFWMLTSLGIAQNDLGGLVLAGLLLTGLSYWVGRNRLGEMRRLDKTTFIHADHSRGIVPDCFLRSWLLFVLPTLR